MGIYYVYAGVNRRDRQGGLYRFRYNSESGWLEDMGMMDSFPGFSYIVCQRCSKRLYAVSGDATGSIRAYRIDAANGDAQAIGTYPCPAGISHLHISPDGRHLFAAAYGSGRVIAIPILEDGSLASPEWEVHLSGSGLNPARQEGPHPHSTYMSKDGGYLVISDLGADKVLLYRIKAPAQPIKTAVWDAVPGMGPRHAAFSEVGSLVYVLTELSSDIVVFSHQGGCLSSLQTISSLPNGYSGENLAADILVSPDGQYLYASNRGHNSIACFRVCPDNGLLILIGHTPTRGWPRAFHITEDGAAMLVLNEQFADSMGELQSFHIHPDGSLFPCEPAMPLPHAYNFTMILQE